MRGAAIDTHLVYYITWVNFLETTTSPPRDVDPTWLVAMLAGRTRAKTLPELAGLIGVLEPSESTGYDDVRDRVRCNVDRYHTAHFALHLARAIVERHKYAGSVSGVMHALLARYHPEMAKAYQPSAAS
jgi:hypothetical protein